MLANGRTQRVGWVGKITLVICVILALIVQGRVAAQAASAAWTVQNADTGQPGASTAIDTLAYGQNGHGQGLWVAGQSAGRIDTSPDGIHWTAGTTQIDPNYTTYFNSVVYGSEWVMVGQSGEVLTSSDGAAWTKQTSNTSQDLYGVTYGNGTYVAVSQGNVIISSTDGTTWGRHSVTGAFEGVTYGNRLFVAVGDSGIIYTSPDGVNWTAQTSHLTSGTNLYAVTYGNGLFVATGDNGTILVSSDGVHWTAESSGTTNQLYGVTYGAGKFVAVGYTITGGTIVSGSATLITSRNGTAWAPETPGTLPSSTAYFTSAAYGGSLFVIGGINSSPASGIIQTQSTNAALSGIGLDHGTLSPAFTSGTTSYQVSVPYTVSSVNVTPTLADSTATMTVNGNPVTSGTVVNVPVSSGASSTVTIVVTAQSGNAKTYSLTVTRAAAGTNATLSSLTVDHGTLSPAFTSGTTSYQVSVPYTVSSVNVTPTLADSTATMTVNGNPGTSGTAVNVPVSPGASSTVTIVITAQSGNTKTYSLTVTRAAAGTNTTLSSLTVDHGTLSPAFTSGTTSYQVSVPYTVSSVNVTPTLADSTATMTVSSATVNGGSPLPVTSSKPIAVPLNLGGNTISIKVTAQNGSTTVYAISVTRAAIETPGGLTHANVTQTGWTETWGPIAGATSYDVYLNQLKVGTVTQTVYDFKGEHPGTAYRVQVSSVGVSGQSGLSATDVVTTAVYGGGGPSLPTIITDFFPEPAQVGQPYSAQVREVGGVYPWRWQIASGSLPVGLTLNTQGVISGTPTTSGNYGFTVKVTDGLGHSASKPLTLVVNGSNGGSSGQPTPPPPPISVTTGTQQAVRTNQPYQLTLLATGGTVPYSWTVKAGMLPAGLTLNPTTGVISGTPSRTGTYQVSVAVRGFDGSTAGKSIIFDVLQPYEREVLWNGQVTNVPAIVKNEGGSPTTYMALWYVMQLLKPIGIQSTWDGKHWHMTSSRTADLSNIEVGGGNTDIYLDGTLVQMVKTVVQDDPSTHKPTTYMPIWYVMKLLNRVGLHSTWNGTTWTVTQ